MIDSNKDHPRTVLHTHRIYRFNLQFVSGFLIAGHSQHGEYEQCRITSSEQIEPIHSDMTAMNIPPSRQLFVLNILLLSHDYRHTKSSLCVEISKCSDKFPTFIDIATHQLECTVYTLRNWNIFSHNYRIYSIDTSFHHFNLHCHLIYFVENKCLFRLTDPTHTCH